MPGFGAFMRGLFKEGFLAVVIEGLKWLAGVGLPILVGIVTAAAGYLQGLPVAYFISAATLAFAMMATGLLRFDEWRAKRTPANKLTLSTPRVVFDYVRDAATGKITGIEYAQVHMGLCNSATFNISYVLNDVFSSVDGHNNQDAKLILNAVMPPSHLQIYRQDRIDMRGSLLKPRMDARLRFKGRYGRPGHEKYPIERNATITCVFDENTGYETQVPQDVPQ